MLVWFKSKEQLPINLKLKVSDFTEHESWHIGVVFSHFSLLKWSNGCGNFNDCLQEWQSRKSLRDEFLPAKFAVQIICLCIGCGNSANNVLLGAEKSEVEKAFEIHAQCVMTTKLWQFFPTFLPNEASFLNDDHDENHLDWVATRNNQSGNCCKWSCLSNRQDNCQRHQCNCLLHCLEKPLFTAAMTKECMVAFSSSMLIDSRNAINH